MKLWLRALTGLERDVRFSPAIVELRRPRFLVAVDSLLMMYS
jgi:hypothetical protein